MFSIAVTSRAVGVAMCTSLGMCLQSLVKGQPVYIFMQYRGDDSF